MDYEFTTESEPVQHVLSIRTFSSARKLPELFSETLASIAQYMAAIGETPVNAAFAAYYNMDMDNLDVEIGFVVDKSLPGSDKIKSGEIPPGRKASCLFKGPYGELQNVYASMQQWMNENNYVPTGVAYEFYYNSPAEVSESELMTRVVFPLR
jgi:effector-binding domain-containing protein